MREPVRGLFITGTDTGVGKTYVAALVARLLAAEGRRVGVYKPVASGCRRDGDRLVSDDALNLWEAADRPGELERVCPQRFAAPLRRISRLGPRMLESMRSNFAAAWIIGPSGRTS